MEPFVIRNADGQVAVRMDTELDVRTADGWCAPPLRGQGLFWAAGGRDLSKFRLIENQPPENEPPVPNLVPNPATLKVDGWAQVARDFVDRSHATDGTIPAHRMRRPGWLPELVLNMEWRRIIEVFTAEDWDWFGRMWALTELPLWVADLTSLGTRYRRRRYR